MFWKAVALGSCLVALAATPIPMGATPPDDVAPVTFTKDVLPILQKNCQTCHRPGEVAPMSFLTYKDTRPWAKAIKTAVLDRQMPPWFADPGYGHFKFERRLSDADLKTLSDWADNGAIEGDSKDMPPAITFQDGWNIKPDLIIEMPKDFNVP